LRWWCQGAKIEELLVVDGTTIGEAANARRISPRSSIFVQNSSNASIISVTMVMAG